VRHHHVCEAGVQRSAKETHIQQHGQHRDAGNLRARIGPVPPPGIARPGEQGEDYKRQDHEQVEHPCRDVRLREDPRRADERVGGGHLEAWQLQWRARSVADRPGVRHEEMRDDTAVHGEIDEVRQREREHERGVDQHLADLVAPRAGAEQDRGDDKDADEDAVIVTEQQAEHGDGGKREAADTCRAIEQAPRHGNGKRVGNQLRVVIETREERDLEQRGSTGRKDGPARAFCRVVGQPRRQRQHRHGEQDLGPGPAANDELGARRQHEGQRCADVDEIAVRQLAPEHLPAADDVEVMIVEETGEAALGLVVAERPGKPHYPGRDGQGQDAPQPRRHD
jgi:hypothetical protein